MADSYNYCKNCDNAFYIDHNYCPHCGQKSNDKLTVGVLFKNTISNYFSVDARFFKSFIPLLIKPGYLANKFVEGKRLLYLHPAQLYLFTSVIFFFIFSFTVTKQERAIRDAVKNENAFNTEIDSAATIKVKDSIATAFLIEQVKENQEIIGIEDNDLQELDSILKTKYQGNNNISFGFNEKKIDSLIAINAPESEIYAAMGQKEDAGYFSKKIYTQILKLYKDNGSIANIVRSFYDTIPIALFFLLPIFAFILKLLFYNRGPFAYHLVFSFYYFSFLFSTFIILLLTSYVWESFPGWIQVLIILSTFIYLCIAVKKFYSKGWILSIFKSGLATLIYFLFVIPIATIFMVLFALMFG